MLHDLDSDHSFKLIGEDGVTLITVQVSAGAFAVAVEINPGANRVVKSAPKLSRDANLEWHGRVDTGRFMPHTLDRCLRNYLSRCIRSPNTLQRNMRRSVPKSGSCSRYEELSRNIYVSLRVFVSCLVERVSFKFRRARRDSGTSSSPRRCRLYSNHFAVR